MIEGRISSPARDATRMHGPCLLCSEANLADQQSIAQALEAALRAVHLLSQVAGKDEPSTTATLPASFVAPDVNIAQRIVRRRAERDNVFGTGIFTDPAWDILLDLFIAGETGQKVSISSVCIAARVPATTALRWVKHLERRKIVSREADELDRRRSFIVLTSETRTKLSGLLRGLNAGIL